VPSQRLGITTKKEPTLPRCAAVSSSTCPSATVECHSVVLSTSANVEPQWLALTPSGSEQPLDLSRPANSPPTPGTPHLSPRPRQQRPFLGGEVVSYRRQNQAPDRDTECDMGCAVATHNIGEFAEMDGDIAEARRKYEEARV
jgi:hypothetical protein